MQPAGSLHVLLSAPHRNMCCCSPLTSHSGAVRLLVSLRSAYTSPTTHPMARPAAARSSNNRVQQQHMLRFGALSMKLSADTLLRVKWLATTVFCNAAAGKASAAGGADR
jgi:hypothetical protein